MDFGVSLKPRQNFSQPPKASASASMHWLRKGSLYSFDLTSCIFANVLARASYNIRDIREIDDIWTNFQQLSTRNRCEHIIDRRTNRVFSTQGFPRKVERDRTVLSRTNRSIIAAGIEKPIQPLFRVSPALR